MRVDAAAEVGGRGFAGRASPALATRWLQAVGFGLHQADDALHRDGQAALASMLVAEFACASSIDCV